MSTDVCQHSVFLFSMYLLTFNSQGDYLFGCYFKLGPHPPPIVNCTTLIPRPTRNLVDLRLELKKQDVMRESLKELASVVIFLITTKVSGLTYRYVQIRLDNWHT